MKVSGMDVVVFSLTEPQKDRDGAVAAALVRSGVSLCADIMLSKVHFIQASRT